MGERERACVRACVCRGAASTDAALSRVERKRVEWKCVCVWGGRTVVLPVLSTEMLNMMRHGRLPIVPAMHARRLPVPLLRVLFTVQNGSTRGGGTGRV